jgi:hypothetical protein
MMIAQPRVGNNSLRRENIKMPKPKRKRAVIQKFLPLLPEGAEPINNNLAIFRNEGEIIFFNGYCPMLKCSHSNPYDMRLAQGILCSTHIVKPAQLAKALGVNRSTVCRNKAIYEKGGPVALVIDKTNRSAYKLDRQKLQKAQHLLDRGINQNQIAEQVGVSEGCIRYAIKKGALVKKSVTKEHVKADLKTPCQRSIEDCQSQVGIGVKREEERTLASVGKLHEAMPNFCANESVRYAGVLLALPLLCQLGLLEVANKVYGSLRKGFYGLQATLLTVAFMALLRIKSPEQLKAKSPGEIGIILVLDRVPEVKTLRRKLKEMCLNGKSAEFMAELTRRWCDEDLDAIGFVYIDGHVRPYNGGKHKLPKTHVARRRLFMAATTDFWVNDANCEPLFLITAEANDSLLSMVDCQIIPHMKELAGDRRVTLIFDREGWSPKRFAQWFEKGVDVITYRKGKYEPWPEDSFIETRSWLSGKPVTYLLAERSIWIDKTFWMREVRRLCDSGHQTSVMTTRQDLSVEQIASRMFSRWSQENFFRYMRHEYNLDHLITYDVEQADGDRLVPCPRYKDKCKQISKMKADLAKLQKVYGQKVFENRGFDIANADSQIKILQQQIDDAKAEQKKMPKKVPLKTLAGQNEPVRLETERKYLTDAIKMACYRSESSLLNLLYFYFARAQDEGRGFLKGLFELPADILPDEKIGTLSINFHPMANPRSNRALKDLCEIINEKEFVFPQTRLKMVFNAPVVASLITPGQEF